MKSAFQAVYKNPFIQNSNLPVLVLSEERVNELLATTSKTIKSLAWDITKTGKPQSININATIGCHIEMGITEGSAPNVIGVISGTDSSAGCLILSAHHDHLGKEGKLLITERWTMPVVQ